MKYSILFFGTSSFACPSLNAIHKNHNLLAVITSPEDSPVKLLSTQFGVKTFDPINPNSPEFLSILKSFAPDFICLAAYGYILGTELLKLPKIGAVNLHPSLLPAYRGPAPIQWAILKGDKTTGITTMSMNEKIDRGRILLQKTVEIQPAENYGELEEQLSKIGADLLIETINKFNSLQPIPQTGKGSYAPKITKEMRKVNWNKPASEIVNLIRALAPKPLAYTIFRNKRLEILKAELNDLSSIPGRIVIAKAPRHGEGYGGKCVPDARDRCGVHKTIIIGTTAQSVELKLLKPEGKREQTALDFINGYRLQTGEIMQ